MLAVLLAAVSCGPRQRSGREAISLVYDIVTGSDARGSRIMSEFGNPASGGEIYIAGSPIFTRPLAARFLECDIADNVRGRKWSDGLKDFAGETFCCMIDEAFPPYSRFASTPDSLRELAVRYLLAALDTRCNVSIYDLDGNAEKSSAKIMVLSDPWLLRYGKFDIDTLQTLTGGTVPVISPQALMLEAVLAADTKSFNVGIICDSSCVSSGIYPELFRHACSKYDVVGAKCTVGSGSLYDFLDSYLLGGNARPLDAILLDDPAADMDAFEEQLKAIRDFSREEYMKYGRCVSQSLRLVSSSALTMEECYRILRSRSLFTHKIAQPVLKNYTVKLHPWGADMQFLLIPE